jgi:hypothetical protein
VGEGDGGTAADDPLDEAVQQVRETEQAALTQQVNRSVRKYASPHQSEASRHPV